ncbi:MAG TPA: hypothetical protein VM934_04145 [Pyrinomonadaceae bacterium]|jgi:hypothetical protein|nr:hypothetical protein [Pyrinomonadaceae bacterium]
MALSLNPHFFYEPIATQDGGRVIKRIVLPKEPIEITNPRIKGQQVKFGQTFNADNRWADALTLSAKNISSQPITSLRIAVYFRVNSTVEHLVNMSLLYDEFEIAPEETVQISTNPKMNAMLIAEVARGGKSIDFSKAEIQVDKVYFKDGTVWSQGSMFSISPDNPKDVKKISALPASEHVKPLRYLTVSYTKKEDVGPCHASKLVLDSCYNIAQICNTYFDEVD